MTCNHDISPFTGACYICNKVPSDDEFDDPVLPLWIGACVGLPVLGFLACVSVLLG